MPLSFSDLLARRAPQPGPRIAYGDNPLQFGSLWNPSGEGPWPVVALIHGGCWLAELPGLELMDHLAGALRDQDYAVWNLEYRRIGHDGGGFPGTFTDVAAGVDRLRRLAKDHALDLTRVVAVGHSAGGHLAMWAAGRSRLPASSPLFCTDPLPIRGVVSLAGILDLRTYRQSGIDACGGPATIDALVDAGARVAMCLYADTSPIEMTPIGVPQVVVSGALDVIVPAFIGAEYTARAAASGDAVNHQMLQDVGHFELIDPLGHAWPAVRDAVARMAQ